MSDKTSTSRVGVFLTREIGGVPLALILCAVAAIALGFGVAMTSTIG